MVGHIWQHHESVAPSCLISGQAAAGGGGLMVGDIFVVHFVLQSTSWASIKCYRQPEHCCWPCLSISDHSGPSSDRYFQQDNAPGHEAQIKNLKLAFEKWEWVPGTLADPVSRSQSSRATLRRGGWEMRQGRGADKSAGKARCYHVNMEQNLQGTFPTLWWKYPTNN